MSRFSAADVTIVTVSYNSSPIIPNMLASIPEGAHVIVVDNAGHDRDALIGLTKKYKFTLIHSDTNIGFGAACNLGAHAAETEYLLMLNPDAQLEHDTLSEFLKTAARHSQDTAFGPKILNADGTENFKRRSILLPRHEWLPRGCPETETKVPVLAGSAIFVTRELFNRYQFDPRIFMYHEDDDWSLRLRQDGGSLILVPTAKVIHTGGRSSGRDSDVTKFKAFHLAKSRIQTLRKHNRPFPKLRSNLLAFAKLASPENIFSARKRAKNIGFLMGVRKYKKHYTTPNQLPTFVGYFPLWKLKRELIRLLWQTLAIPRALYDRFFVTLWYDISKRRKIREEQGEVQEQGKVAIYLIFPKMGLLESHRRALEYIRSAGYAPLIVSNLPLSETDRLELKKLAWRVIERPNIGYDFGGYRDGYLSLQPILHKLTRLVFLNDSSWFPIPQTSNWLLDAEALGVDFAGAATSYGILRVGREQYHSIQWEYNPSLSEFHYCSYAISIGPKLLQNSKFLRFWKNYKLTAKKNKVVRHGEIGMSRFAVDNKFTHGATYDIRTLPDSLASCSDDELNRYAHNLLYLGEWMMKEVLNKVLPDLNASKSAADRQDVINLLLATAARFGISYAMPEFLWEKHKFPFLKKSPVSLCKADSDIMLSLARKMSEESKGAQYIFEEIETIRSKKPFWY